MKHLCIPVFLLVITTLISCSEDKQIKVELENIVASSTDVPVKNYLYNPSTTEVKWTAFKQSKKVPVNGKFDSVLVSGFNSSNKLSESITGVSMELFTSSTNTNDKARDLKIVNSFFGNLLNSVSLKATIISANGDVSGDGVLLIDMNGVTKEQPYTWSVDDYDELFMKTTINVLDWGGESALAALNKVCEAKHTGPDDKESTLWPDVEIIVLSRLDKE